MGRQRSPGRAAPALLAAALLALGCGGPPGDPTPPRASESLFAELRGARLHYLAAGPADGRPVLLLHGMRYHSGTWLELGTLRVLSEAGYRALALDLPGFGRSDPLEGDAGPLLREILERLGMDRPVVLVAPSMSGLHAFPLLIEHPGSVAGFVALAPAGIERHATELGRIEAPTLVVWGENDRILPPAMADSLANAIPGAAKTVVPGAGHAAYLDRPETFHRLLLAFLDGLAETGARRQGEPGGQSR